MILVEIKANYICLLNTKGENCFLPFKYLTRIQNDLQKILWQGYQSKPSHHVMGHNSHTTGPCASVQWVVSKLLFEGVIWWRRLSQHLSLQTRVLCPSEGAARPSFKIKPLVLLHTDHRKDLR